MNLEELEYLYAYHNWDFVALQLKKAGYRRTVRRQIRKALLSDRKVLIKQLLERKG